MTHLNRTLFFQSQRSSSACRVTVALLRAWALALCAIVLGLGLSIVHAEPITRTGIRDCGANAVFTLSRVIGSSVSYERSLQLAPYREQGNSLQEVRDALTAIGVAVEAVSLSPEEFAGLRVPAVMLVLPPTDSTKIGHYLVVRPLGNGDIQLLDFPREPQILSVQDWIQFTTEAGTKQIHTLLCGKPGETLAQMLRETSGFVAAKSIKSEAPATRPAAPANNIASSTAPIPLEAGARRSPIATHHFGDVAEGSTVRHSFTLENTTDKPIVISRFEQSCACTDMKADAMRIEPGKRAIVTMTASLAGRYTTTRVDAAVYFDAASRRPPVLLVMQGTAHGRFVFVPPLAELGQLGVGRGVVTQRIRVRPTEYAGGQRVDKVLSQSPSVVATIVKSDFKGADPGATIDVSFDPTTVSGVFSKRVEAFVAGEKLPAAAFEIRAQVESAVMAVPSSLLVTAGTSNTDVASARLLIEHHGRKRMRLLESHAIAEAFDPGDIAVVESPQQDDKGLSLVVGIKGVPPFTRKIALKIGVEGDQATYDVTVPFVYVQQHSPASR